MENILYFWDTNQVLLFLFVIGIVAGLVDTIAGGGGLITVPSLLLAGVPPIIALGTNRLQASMGELSASVNFFLRSKIDFNHLPMGALFVAIGAGSGSYAVSIISNEALKLIIPFLMVAITIYSIFSKRLKNSVSVHAKITKLRFMIICGLLIGFYNGFFGPGVGSIWILASTLLLGYSLKEASIFSKPLNLIGNIVSLIFFIFIGTINYKIAFVMGTGQIIGATLGSHMVIKDGDRIIRPVFITVTTTMTLKLLYENFHKSFF